MTNREIALFTAETLDSKKGKDIVILDISESSSFADYFVNASALNLRLLTALCDEVEDRLAEKGTRVKNIEGKGGSEWILMDFGDVIVNLFTEEKREHYQIERIWKDCPELDFIPAEDR